MSQKVSRCSESIAFLWSTYSVFTRTQNDLVVWWLTECEPKLLKFLRLYYVQLPRVFDPTNTLPIRILYTIYPSRPCSFSYALLRSFESVILKGIPQHPTIPKLNRHLKPIYDCHCILLSISLVPQFLTIKLWMVAFWKFLRHGTYSQFCNTCLVYGIEFSTPVNPTIMKDPQESIDDDMINLICLIASSRLWSP